MCFTNVVNHIMGAVKPLVCDLSCCIIYIYIKTRTTVHICTYICDRIWKITLSYHANPIFIAPANSYTDALTHA